MLSGCSQLKWAYASIGDKKRFVRIAAKLMEGERLRRGKAPCHTANFRLRGDTGGFMSCLGGWFKSTVGWF